MRTNRKIGMVLVLLLAITLSMIVGQFITYAGDGTSEWEKRRTEAILSELADGGINIKESGQSWGGGAVTTLKLKTPLSVLKPIDFLVKINEGVFQFAIASNGFHFDWGNLNNGASGNNWAHAGLVFAMVDGNNLKFTNGDIGDWWAKSAPKNAVGYDKFSLIANDSGTEFYANGTLIYTFATKKAEYASGNLMLSCGGQYGSILNTDIRMAPIATENKITYNRFLAKDFQVYYQFGSIPLQNVKIKAPKAQDFVTLAQTDYTATNDKMNIAGARAVELFTEIGLYALRIETVFGNIDYEVLVTNEADSTIYWSQLPSGFGKMTAKDDGAVTFSSALSAATPDGIVEGYRYAKPLSVQEDINVYIAPTLGLVSLRLVSKDTTLLTFNLQKEFNTGKLSYEFSGAWKSVEYKLPYNLLTFRIGELQTEILVNGSSLGKLKVGKDAFANGKANLDINTLFYSWAQKSSCDIRVGTASAILNARYTVGQTRNLNLNFDVLYSTVTAIKCGGKTISAVDYTLSDTGAIMTAENAAKYFTTPGIIPIEVESLAGNVSFSLTVSTSRAMELEKSVLQYDLFLQKNNPLEVTLYANLDTFAKVTGNGSVSTDFTYQNDTLTIHADYLATLPVGSYDFKIYSTEFVEGGEGLLLTIQVLDSAPPAVNTENKTFDKHVEVETSFIFVMKQNTFLRVEGNGVAASHYDFVNDKLTFHNDYLQTLAANTTHTFSVVMTNGTVQVFIKIINSKPPTSEIVLRKFNPSSPGNMNFVIDLYDGEFVGLKGNNITKDDYVFSNQTLSIYGEFLSKLVPKNYEFVLEGNYGTLTLTVEISEKDPPVLIGSAAQVFDVQVPNAILYTFDMKLGKFERVTGGNILATDYSFEAATQNLTILQSYLEKLQVGEYYFVFEAENGIINLSITIENKKTVSFSENSVQTELVLQRSGTDCIEIPIFANRGKFISFLGNDITTTDYSFNNGKLLINAKFLNELTYQDTMPYVLEFDNGILYLTIRFELVIDNTYSWTEETNCLITGGENGFATVTQTAIESAFLYSYTTKYSQPLDITKPIHLYYNLITEPDGKWLYTFNVSPNGHNNFFDPVSIFAQFAATATHFKTLRAGSYPSDENRYIENAKIVKNENGIDEFIFDIGVMDTKIYINGELAKTCTKKRSDFPNNKAYLMLSSVSTYNTSANLPTVSYGVRVNGDVLSGQQKAQFNTRAPQNVVFDLTFENSQFESVYLVENEIYTKLTNYSFVYTKFAKSGTLTFLPSDILNESALALVGKHQLEIRSNGGKTRVMLVVSDHEALELSESEMVCDLRENMDLEVLLYVNLDTFTCVTGNGISTNDFSFVDHVLIFKIDYLKTLNFGRQTFQIISEKNPTGAPFVINVADLSEPEIVGEKEKIFDIQLPSDISFEVNIKASNFVGLSGNEISLSDYTFTNGILTFKTEYLKTLSTGKHKFVIAMNLFEKEIYLECTVKITNSLLPTFENGTKLENKDFVLSSTGDLTMTLKANSGKFLGLYGAYISSDDYVFDQTKSILTIKKEYLQSLKKGQYTLNINFDNGKIDLVVNVKEESIKPEEPKNGCAKGQFFGGSDGGMGMFGVIALFSFGMIEIRKRRNYAK